MSSILPLLRVRFDCLTKKPNPDPEIFFCHLGAAGPVVTGGLSLEVTDSVHRFTALCIHRPQEIPPDDLRWELQPTASARRAGNNSKAFSPCTSHLDMNKPNGLKVSDYALQKFHLFLLINPLLGKNSLVSAKFSAAKTGS